MSEVKFDAIDPIARTATFTVGGVPVTRRIPAKFAGPVDDYLSALAAGLAVEFPAGVVVVAGKPMPVADAPDAISKTSFRRGDVLVAAAAPAAVP